MLKKLFWLGVGIGVIVVVMAKLEQRRAADEAELWAEATDEPPA